MCLKWLHCLIFDLNRDKAKRIFYITGCFVSTIAIVSSLASLIAFAIDYSSEEPLFDGLSSVSHRIGYVLCLVLALLASLPPFILGAVALQDLPRYEKFDFAGPLCGLAVFDNLHCHGSATRYLLFATLSAATVILSNTMSVGALHAGVGWLFEQDFQIQSSKRTDSSSMAVDRLQRSLYCCGLSGPDDWRLISTNHDAQHGLPKSCLAKAQDGNGRRDGTMLIYSDGCASILSGEQAVTRGISNMLVFASVLLLLASWTKIEKVAENKVTDVKNLFKQPRAPAEAAAFVERVGRHRSGSGRVGQKQAKTNSNAITVVGRKDLRNYHASCGHYQQPLVSKGFLYPLDDLEEPRYTISCDRMFSNSENKGDPSDPGNLVISSIVPCSGGGGSGGGGGSSSSSSSSSSESSDTMEESQNSNSASSSPLEGASDIRSSHIIDNNSQSRNSSGTNSDTQASDSRDVNNSALDFSQPWLGAQVITAISAEQWNSDFDDDSDSESEFQFNSIEEEQISPYLTGLVKVEIKNETEERVMKQLKQLDVKLLTNSEPENHQRLTSWTCRKAGFKLIDEVSRKPVFLFDYSETQWHLLLQHQEQQVPFSTRESANFINAFN